LLLGNQAVPGLDCRPKDPFAPTDEVTQRSCTLTWHSDDFPGLPATQARS